MEEMSKKVDVRPEKRDKSQSISPEPQRKRDSDRDSVSSSKHSERGDSNEAEKAEEVAPPVVEEVKQEVVQEEVVPEPEKVMNEQPPSTEADLPEDDQFDHLAKAAEDLVATWTAEVRTYNTYMGRVEACSF